MLSPKVGFFYRFPIFLLLLSCLFLVSCDRDDDSSSDDKDADDDDNDDNNDNDNDNDTEQGGLQREKLEALFEELGFLPYLEINPIRRKDALNGYKRYFFDTTDIKCYNGSAASVAVSYGSGKNVMFFMESGGASWPGYSLALEVDILFDIGYRNRYPLNPLRDWHFVYVPYCDNSVHLGDSEAMENGKLVYHHGLRHTAAAVALMKKLFPNPDKILVSGASAGGFGTFMAWAIVKSQYMDTDTYVLGDSGVGFFNPDEPETWESIQKAWNVHIPDDCEKCNGSVLTYIYEVFMKYDPQVHIGMFTSYYDGIISHLFLDMERDAFRSLLMKVTNEIKTDYPERFARYFIKGGSHTCYAPLLRGGPKYEVNGLSLYEWIDRLVNDDPAWDDVLE